MELGATVCAARTPACARCPIRPDCRAHADGRTALFPEATERPVSRKVRRACVILERGDHVLLAREDQGRRLRGLWRFPGVVVRPRASAAGAARQVLSRLGFGAPSLRADGAIRHAIMDERIETLLFRGSPRNGSTPPPGTRWFRWRELARLPLSTVELQVLDQFSR
jgi:A/G-specific adenine glycosylase